MKKNLIAIITVLSMIIPTAAVFADEEVTYLAPEGSEVQGDIMPVSADIEVPVDADAEYTAAYISHTATVTSVEEGKIVTTTNTDDASNPEFEIDFNIKETTVAVKNTGKEISVSDIQKGDSVTVFTGADEPTIMMLPAHYTANVIVVNDKDDAGIVDVDKYSADEEGTLTNAANSLSLNFGEETEVVGVTGKASLIDELNGKDLIVFYLTTTRSIPAQTTPSKIMVIGKTEDVPTETTAPEVNVEVSVLDGYNSYATADGVTMYPLRAIAEANGFTVTWDGELRAVMINDGMYSLKIGENNYIKGRMAPIQLGAAPEITGDLTYVPAEFFTEVLELN